LRNGCAVKPALLRSTGINYQSDSPRDTSVKEMKETTYEPINVVEFALAVQFYNGG
jgi:hypothetical protein